LFAIRRTWRENPGSSFSWRSIKLRRCFCGFSVSDYSLGELGV
jgi:hypothetical protein